MIFVSQSDTCSRFVMNEIPKVAIGHGSGLFSALRKPLRPGLIEARRLAGGTAIHVYRPIRGNT
jgi:hypothetical protein